MFDLTGSKFSKLSRLQDITAHQPAKLQDKTIGTDAAELLTIKRNFFVGFRGYPENGIGVLKRAKTDMHQIW